MTRSKEEKNKLKSDRVKQVLASAAKDIILEKGVTNVSVRKVADQAGLSLGTIYNHFKNLDELLWLTRDIMIVDITQYISPMNIDIHTLDDVKQSLHLYVDYYVQNPNVFRFFYFHHLNSDDKPNTSVTDSPDFQSHTEKTFTFLMTTYHLNQDEIALIFKSLIYSIHGMLTLLISDNDGLTIDTLYSDLDDLIDKLIIH